LPLFAPPTKIFLAVTEKSTIDPAPEKILLTPMSRTTKKQTW